MKYALSFSIITILILSFAVVKLRFQLIDQAITADYNRANSEYGDRTSKIALQLLNEKWNGESRRKVREISEEFKEMGLLVKETKSQISIGQIVFVFSPKNIVSSVYYYGDMPESMLE